MLNDLLEKKNNLKDKIDRFKESAKPKNPNKKEKIEPTSENAKRLLKERQKVLNGFESKIFPIVKQAQGKEHSLH